MMTLNHLIIVTVAASLLGLAAIVVSWPERPCDSSGAGIKGLERIMPDGRHEWFDGRCWTRTPQPPMDTPARGGPPMGRPDAPRR
jgi:hypothetical protein